LETAITKRLIDLIFACVGLVLTFPLFVLFALLIKLDSPGPIFYRGLRSGRGDKEFRILKFRTMTHDRVEIGAMTTARNDPRVTRLGRMMRKNKFDEIPQLLDIIRGEMSFVGPRPEFPKHTAKYTSEEREILCVRPGITDLASLEFINLDEIVGEDDPDAVYMEKIWTRKMELRLRYVRESSLWLDFKILQRTIGAVLTRIIRSSD